MEPIGLVKSNQKTIGWICLEDLESPKTLHECMDLISGDILISSSTPLLEAIHLYCRGDNYIYLVLKGNQFIGFLNYSHFHKLPFRLCLFALLMDLERTMLKITKSNPTLFLKNLTKGRVDYAEKIRNSIAHPEGKQSVLLPIERKELLPFIKWIEELQQQLDDYVNQTD